jgi:mono/diheme cytochrome c family protein
VTRTSITGSSLAVIVFLALVTPIAAQGPQRGAAPPGNRPAPTSPVTGNAVSGKALYYSYSCYACHGYSGETGRAFVGNWSRNLESEESFITFLRARANLAPVQPSTSMPSFAESTMSDNRAKDIYAYIRTFTSHAPELKDIPTLNQIIKAASTPYTP